MVTVWFYASVNNALFSGIDEIGAGRLNGEGGVEENKRYQLKSEASNQPLPNRHQSVKLESIVIVY